MLKVDPAKAGQLEPLALADSDAVNVGDTAIAIGYPLGLDRTVTAGIVSGLGREIKAPNGFSIDKVIQTDAPINPGNSGGPLLDDQGRVIGVNSQIATTAGNAGGSVGIGFAVPSNIVRQIVPKLELGKKVEHAYLGVSTSDAPSGGGALVREVNPGTPAAKAGSRPRPASGEGADLIVAIDGKAVASPDEVISIVGAHKPGDHIKVDVIRDGRQRSLDVTRPRPGRAARASSPERPERELRRSALAARPAARRRGGAAVRARHARARRPPRGLRERGARAVAHARPAGFRRHVAPLLYAIAAAALIVALARPQATVAVPIEQATVVLVTDHSRSMEATDVKPNRLQAAKDAANQFLDDVPDNVRVGAVMFNHRAQLVQVPATDREPIRERPRRPQGRGWHGDGRGPRARARRRPPADAPGEKAPPAAIILLADGKSSNGRDALEVAKEAKKAGVPVHTVALGTGVGALPGGGTATADQESLRQIALASGGRFQVAGNAKELQSVYKDLGSKIAKRDERREVTVAAVGGGLLLLLAGGAFSLTTFGRLP